MSSQTYGLDQCPDLWPALQRHLRIPETATDNAHSPVQLHNIHLRASQLDDPLQNSLCGLLGEEAVRIDKLTRLAHSYGKSYRDLIRIRAGYVPNPPDAVIYPADPSQVTSVLTWASEREIAVIPYGGGTSLNGAIEPSQGNRPAITLDMARLSRVLAVDAESMTARIQAGATGSAIEAQLNEHGFTLGHFPQSHEFSTLGGWIATRSVGRCAVAYGGIDRLTQAIKVVTPTGLVETGAIHHTEPGPSLLNVLIGSEGSYGVITEALMRIHPLPRTRDCRVVRFGNWRDGVAACRELVLNDSLRPTMMHLADPLETMALALTMPGRYAQKGLLAGILSDEPLRSASWHPYSDEVLLVVGFEGELDWTKQQWALTLAICDGYRGRITPKAAGQPWEHHLRTLPYLRDELIARGLIVDTVTASTSWSDIHELYESVRGALSGAISSTGVGASYVMTHLSSVDRHGTTLVATYLAMQTSDPSPLVKQAQCETIRRAAKDAILARGGSHAHHHPSESNGLLGQARANTLLSSKLHGTIKQTFDPVGILNPGPVGAR